MTEIKTDTHLNAHMHGRDNPYMRIQFFRRRMGSGGGGGGGGGGERGCWTALV